MRRGTFALAGLAFVGAGLVTLLALAARKTPIAQHHAPLAKASAAEAVPTARAAAADSAPLAPSRPAPRLADIVKVKLPRDIDSLHDIPKGIPAGEGTDGFEIADGSGRAIVVDRAIPDDESSAPRACFARMTNYSLEDGMGIRWMALGPMADIPERYDDGPPAQRQEWLMLRAKIEHDAGDRVFMERTVAWVDGKTHASRAIEKSRYELTVLTRAPGGAELLAARDDKRVEVVMNNPARIAGRAANVQVRESGSSRSLGNCAFASATLSLDKAGASEMAIFHTDVLLADGPPADEVMNASLREIRSREMSATVSLTRFGHESEPSLSFSAGWSGREATFTR